MLALYIILGIIAFIFIILHFPIVASVDFSNEKFILKVRYLFFSLYPLRQKKSKKLSRRKRKKLEKELEKEKSEYNALLAKNQSVSSENEKSKIKQIENKMAEDENKSSDIPKKEKKEEKLFDKLKKYKEKFDEYKEYIPIGKKAVRKMIKAIHITDFDLYIAVADEDAYECAMKYGRVNIAVYNALGLVKRFLTFKIKKIRIESKFNSNETEYSLKCKIKTRPSTILAIAVCILFNYLYTNHVKQKQSKCKETEMRVNG